MNNQNLESNEISKLKFSPEENHDAISIMKMKDGNYRGFMYKNGKLIQARQNDPGIVLQMLLTAE